MVAGFEGRNLDEVLLGNSPVTTADICRKPAQLSVDTGEAHRCRDVVAAVGLTLEFLAARAEIRTAVSNRWSERHL
jgi:hypothetical protein